MRCLIWNSPSRPNVWSPLGSLWKTRPPPLPPLNFNCMILGEFSRLMMPLKAISWLSSLCLHPDSCCATRSPQKHPLACLLVFSSDALVRVRWRTSAKKKKKLKIGCIRNDLYWSDIIWLQQFSRDEASKKQSPHNWGRSISNVCCSCCLGFSAIRVACGRITTNRYKREKNHYLRAFILCSHLLPVVWTSHFENNTALFRKK